MARRDLSGLRFGRLVVLELSPKSGKQRTFWKCQCDCGNICEPRADALKPQSGAGVAHSCGCLHKDKVREVGKASRRHNYCGTRTYSSWGHMIRRCRDPRSPRYSDYGGRGITVCEEWTDFLAFLRDMGECPASGTIERRDNAKGYHPSNCYWASYTQQNRNRRNSLFVSHAGRLVHLAEYAELRGIPYKTAYFAVRRGALSAVRMGE